MAIQGADSKDSKLDGDEPMKRRVFERIEESRQEIVEFTKEIIEIPTINPPGENYRWCVEFLRGKLEEMGLETKTIEVPKAELKDFAPHGEGLPRPSLLSELGEGARRLQIHCHYDVVPGKEDQFRAYLEGERLYGRGSSDMKGGLASTIYAVKALIDLEIDLDGVVSLSMTPDEETGGLAGAKFLLDKGYLERPDGVVMPEPTSGLIWNASRGVLALRLTVKGRSAHSAIPHLGVNAFDGMLDLAERLREIEERVGERRTGHYISPEESRSSVLMMGGEVEGGRRFNIVPDVCSFTIDRRFNPEEKLEEARDEILGVVEELRVRGLEIDVETMLEGDPVDVSPEEDVCRCLADAVSEVRGMARFSLCPGFLDTRHFAERGIPSVAFGPGLIEVSHGDKEFVYVGDILDCAKILSLTAIKFFE